MLVHFKRAAGKTRVLILDDEPAIRLTLSAIFRQAGYQVAIFATGQEAVDGASEFNPDVALLDVFVPGLDGVAVAIRLADRFPRCGVFLLSGASELPPLFQEAVGQGYRFKVVGKPISPVVLLQEVKAALQRDLSNAA